jgi:hypothetical protein
MSINILSAMPASTAYSATSTNSINGAPVSPNANSADTSTPFLTPNDISTLERLYGKSNLTELEADPNGLDALNVVNNIRKNGVQGDITTFMPAANLTSSDASLLENLTGTTTIAAAVASSSDALSLALNISGNRQDGSLVGNVSTGYLQNILTNSTQLEMEGESGHLASSAFLDQAITDIQKTTEPSSGTVVDATA